MIKIPLQRLQQEGDLEFHFSGSQEELGLSDIEFPVREIDIRFHLIEADHGYYLAGDLAGIASLECHRCLTTFTRVLDLELSTLIVLDNAEEFELEDDIIYIPDDAQAIDVTGYIHDAILLDLPVKFLCKKDCQGLCAQCGTNLNVSSCDCDTETIDPRWQKLRELNLEE
ncbi:MAG: DUF177 domain-containing protein [Candidatus Marinimicrobia bacterium]|nr:DUF177 domain-containing protein [Candidatus Neomarinimicrobiota bacterium]MCF7830106.1 DUF177 domain-containing protein [Candidatus Neomarinimicrobiota bacterium]MCF7882153.1 DUF177 domain-containing protein [Candidatus Neomarinimicrobiota bacterium]